MRRFKSQKERFERLEGKKGEWVQVGFKSQKERFELLENDSKDEDYVFVSNPRRNGLNTQKKGFDWGFI